MILRAKAFSLRPFRKGDEISLRTNINSRNVSRYTLRIPFPYLARHARGWVKKNISLGSRRKADELNFAIDMKGEVVGGISLMHIEKHKAEIGYWLGEKYWGRGIMTEVVKLVCGHAFGRLKLGRIYASVFRPNRASARVLEKAGFRLEGINRKNCLKNGRIYDGMLYAKTR
ncbi:TPA: GNAT family N-acetyltransferase [Candidatus Woesearchaeota archaeon]|nr:GNAT family N-acetyltransferase [Candidatus Woesearchaeota archaeon]